MPTPVSQLKTVKLTGGKDGGVGIVTGPGTSAQPGDIVKFDKFTANMLINAELAVEVQSKGRDK